MKIGSQEFKDEPQGRLQGPPSWLSQVGRGEYSKDLNVQQSSDVRALSGEIHGVSDHKSVNSELTIIEGSSRKVRLESVRSELYQVGIDGPTLVDSAVASYLEWVGATEHLVLGLYDPKLGYLGWVAVKASKRGNDVYAKRVKERFSEVMGLPDIRFFNYKDRSKRHKTRALFATLEYNANELTIGVAWEQVGEDYNRWVSKLRERYGSIQLLRVWEAHKSGYPHIHVIMIFEAQEFTAFHCDGVWRVDEKEDLEWDHGFVDVEALSSTRGGLHYVAKYLGKLHSLGVDAQAVDGGEAGGPGLSCLVSQASAKTLGLMWLFRKRAFSMSGGLVDEIRALHNSKPGPEYWELVQVDLVGGAPAEALKRWVLLGFWSGELVKDGWRPWSVDLSRADYMRLKSSEAWSDNRYLVATKVGPLSGWDV